MANDSRNNDMEALRALLGLGLMGAMLGNDNGVKMEHPFIQAMKQEKERQTASGKRSINPQQSKPTAIEGAKAAKELYDSYVTVGFTQDQAFELLKTALSTGMRK